MKLLHRIGKRLTSNFNTLDEILACNEPLSFDGIYDSVLVHADALIGKDITLFFMGKYLGGSNAFDVGEPYGRYLDLNQVLKLAERLNAKLGYHSYSHMNLTQLSDEQIMKEIRPPFPMDYFAYPGGTVNARVARLVEEAGYKEAWSVTQGDGSRFQRNRSYLNW